MGTNLTEIHCRYKCTDARVECGSPERKQIRMMSKKGTCNSTITRNESSISNESSETIASSASQSQDIQVSDGSIDNQTKLYIDTVIQSTAAAIMRNMQQLMDRQIETQRQWNSQYMETINQRFERLEQMNLQNDNISGNQGNDIGITTAEGNQESTVEINRDTSTSQGNYPHPQSSTN